uniref:Uncharacterized protein n=1 Tax=Magallana gigas TaxID=29159 RepID=A0A8W8NZH4_MAGGI
MCPNQSGSGKSSNDIKDNEAEEVKEDCFSEEEAIEGHLKKVFIEATDKSKYDPLAFLKMKEETIRSIL